MKELQQVRVSTMLPDALPYSGSGRVESALDVIEAPRISRRPLLLRLFSGILHLLNLGRGR